jgi:hypothetical protein
VDDDLRCAGAPDGRAGIDAAFCRRLLDGRRAHGLRRDRRAFLEQQEVQSVCDGAALAAANAADEAVLYADGVGSDLPLTRATAQAAVADQLADGGAGLDAWSAETDGVEVTVRCTRSVEIAFGWLFLGGRPLERTALASARAPTAP